MIKREVQESKLINYENGKIKGGKVEVDCMVEEISEILLDDGKEN